MPTTRRVSRSVSTISAGAASKRQGATEMTELVLSLALVVSMPVLVLVLSRSVAAIPSKGTNSKEERGSPRLPAWLVRASLPTFQAMAMVSLAGAFSPTWDIFLWSLAGPWAVLKFTEGASVVMAAISATLLVAGIASYPIRPGAGTAFASLLCGLGWFALGFGTLRIGV